jgi:hypothetical protein
MTWITGHLDCGHDMACDCDDQQDPRIVGAWQDIGEATTSKRVAQGGATGRPSSPAGPDHTGHKQRTSLPSPARALRLARDEQAARTALYRPTGNVIAFPAVPPINSNGAGVHPDAAA